MKKRQIFLMLTLGLFIIGSNGCSPKPESPPAPASLAQPEEKEAPIIEMESEEIPQENLPLFSAHTKRSAVSQQPVPVKETKLREPKKKEAKTAAASSPDTRGGTTTTAALTLPKVTSPLPFTAVALTTLAMPASPKAGASPHTSSLNPLTLYDFEVVEERYEPYSSFSPDEMVAYWRVINSQVKNKEDNFKQAKIILYQMKRKYPKASIYNMDINERYYSVNKKFGSLIPNSDQIDKAGNY